MKKDKQKTRATIAPGIDDHAELNRKATTKDIEENEYTEVTTLSYDEVDPS